MNNITNNYFSKEAVITSDDLVYFIGKQAIDIKIKNKFINSLQTQVLDLQKKSKFDLGLIKKTESDKGLIKKIESNKGLTELTTKLEKERNKNRKLRKQLDEYLIEKKPI